MLAQRLAEPTRGRSSAAVVVTRSVNAISSRSALRVVAAETAVKHWDSIRVHRGRPSKSKAREGAFEGVARSQQVARNLFLWQGRSYLSKGLEAYFTRYLLELPLA